MGGVRPREIPGSRWRALALVQLAVIGMTALTIAVAEFRGAAVRESLKQVEYLLVFLGMTFALARDRRLDLVMRFVAIIGGWVALLAISQEFAFAASWVDVSGHRIVRVAGPLEGPNQLAKATSA